MVHAHGRPLAATVSFAIGASRRTVSEASGSESMNTPYSLPSWRASVRNSVSMVSDALVQDVARTTTLDLFEREWDGVRAAKNTLVSEFVDDARSRRVRSDDKQALVAVEAGDVRKVLDKLLRAQRVS